MRRVSSVAFKVNVSQIEPLCLIGYAGSRIRNFMAKKRKKKTFSAAVTVREMARERVGSPKPSQLVRAKTAKPEKYKPTLGKLLGEE